MGMDVRSRRGITKIQQIVYNTKCEFNGVDFEADLWGMYTEVRRCLAVDFPHVFGPES